MKHQQQFRFYGLLPKQYEFITSTEKEVLFVGGKGCAKSYALCVKLIMQAQIPGNTCLLVRKNLSHLKMSTLATLLEPHGTRPPLLFPSDYSHNKIDRTIVLNGGGKIIYTGCDDPMSIRSINAGGIFLDEASQLDETEYTELLWRLRVNCGCRQLFACTNPANQGHFLFNRFVVEKDPTRKLINATSFDNWFLTEDVTQWMSGLSKAELHRHSSSDWIAAEAMIYKMWDRKIHVNDININNECYNIVRWVIGLDYGFKNPTAILLCGFSGDGTLYVFDEWIGKEQRHSQIIEQLKKYHEMLKVITKEEPTIVIDPSAATFISECIANGFTAIKAKNDVDLGIDRVRNKLDRKQLIVNRSCETLQNEFDNYSYGDDGKPIKVHDHCADSLRYVLNYAADALADETIEDQKGEYVWLF